MFYLIKNKSNKCLVGRVVASVYSGDVYKRQVDDFIAEAKPEDKMEYIKKEQAAGKLVAMMLSLIHI